MVIVKKNRDLLARKQFLLRAVYNNHKTTDEIKPELLIINRKILENLKEVYDELKIEVKKEVVIIKEKIYSDGDMKRNVAKLIYSLFKEYYNNEEMKGIFRQGYKYMRANI